MAFTFGFYNSLNHDRMYDAVQMSQFFDGLITDGVYGTVGERFKIKTSTLNNTVVVGSGRAWFNHTWNYNDADLPITGSSPNVLYNRYDAIVIDINSDTNYRLNQIIYVTGTGSSNPVKPTMINTATHHQYPLCYIYRKTNVSIISESDIEYVVGTDECPYVESSLTDTKNIAQVELNDKASKAYSDGEYILWHDELYKVVSAISKGLNLIPYPDDGYNIRRTTITSELYGSLGLLDSVVSNSEHGVTSTGIYKALGNRTSLPTAYSAPASGGTNLITNGQVYTALGNRERLSIETGSLENHANSWANYEIPTTYALTVAIGNKYRIIPTDSVNKTHSNSNCEYIMTSKGLYTALGNRNKINTSAPTSGSSDLITSGQVYTALRNRTKIPGFQVVSHDYEYKVGPNGNNTYVINVAYSGASYIFVGIVGHRFMNDGIQPYLRVIDIRAECIDSGTKYNVEIIIGKNNTTESTNTFTGTIRVYVLEYIA